MEQLIKITTVPIQYTIKVNRARLEHHSSKAELEISRNKGGLSIKSRPVKLNLDSFEARNSVVPTTARSVRQTAQKGSEAAYSATAQFAQEGHLMVNAKLGDDVLSNIFAQRSAAPTGDFELGFIPNEPVNIDYQAPDNIEMSITQHPDILIEYIGGPIYVPPSADPNYEPIDVRV